MIAYISGILLEKMDTSVVVDTGGIGYEVFLAANSRVFLKSRGDEIVLSTVQIVKEDDMRLYGFEDKPSLRLFKLLITVSGVGEKAALAILSAMSTEESVRAIAFGDAPMLTRANGIGKKSAERIILELKDKVTEVTFGGAAPGPGGETPAASGAAGGGNLSGDAIEVLLTLGYNRSEAAAAVLKIASEPGTVEELVKLALKNM
jgi:Holliday junction DNA helicase RuvA